MYTTMVKIRQFMSVFHTCSLDRALYPNELAEFVKQPESISMSGNSSKGEDMDARLEEVNRDSNWLMIQP